MHGFSRPRDSRLSEMSSFTFSRYRASASRELRTRDHRNEVTSQSQRHGASGMKHTAPNNARDSRAAPPRSVSMSICRLQCSRFWLVKSRESSGDESRLDVFAMVFRFGPGFPMRELALFSAIHRALSRGTIEKDTTPAL